MHRFITIVLTLTLGLAVGCETTEDVEDIGRDVLGVDLLSQQEFVTQASSMGLYEVQSSQLAIDRNVNPATRDFALELVSEHASMNQRLRELATRQGLAVPAEMLPRDRERLQNLREAEGNAFASTFRRQQIRAHEDAIALFDRASRELDSEPLRDFAAESLPSLREHLTELRERQFEADPLTQ